MINTKEVSVSEEQIMEFLKYYESCFNCKLEKLTSKEILVLIDAVDSEQFLNFLYCHL